jgi:hypothetical protein
MNLNQREKAFEDLYASNEELHFKVRARRNKLAGLWAAEKMGKSPEAANAYALELVTAFLEREQLYARIKKELEIAGINIADAELGAKINEFVTESRKHFMDQIPS